MGYINKGNMKINSTIGKLVENIKLELKQCRMSFNELKFNNELNVMDIFLLNNGDEILEKAEVGIKRISEFDYIGIIKRSMKKNEICLGRVDESNLRVVEGIEIGTLKKISYNLVEEDIYNYLRRVRRKNPNCNLEFFVNEYIKSAHLSENSKIYLEILLSVPYDTIKSWKRYISNKNLIEPTEYLNIITKTISYELRSV